MNIAILVENQTNTNQLVDQLLMGNFAELDGLSNSRIGVFSKSEIDKFIERYPEDKNIDNVKKIQTKLENQLSSSK